MANPVGRPSDYKPEFCEKLVEHMSKGYSFESFGAVIDCGKASLYKWRDEHQEFSDALDMGRSKHLFMMEQMGQGNMVEHYQGPKLNTALYKLFMANIHGWREKTDVEQKSEASVKVYIDSDDAEF
jgi:transposase-like protein